MNMNNSEQSDALIRQLYSKLKQLESTTGQQHSDDAIAIIGLGCQLPCGVNSLNGFTEQLESGQPWPATDMSSRFGGDQGRWRSPLVDGVSHFDPEFFSIAEQEAQELDPQQRVLLEAAHRATSDAGYSRPELKGKPIGVFVGMSSDDYQYHTVAGPQEDSINAFNTLGTARSIAAGRVAYAFDLQGPVLQVDTACSSSLMAIHLACQSLQAGDAEMAIAGGVNLLLAKETFETRVASCYCLNPCQQPLQQETGFTQLFTQVQRITMVAAMA